MATAGEVVLALRRKRAWTQAELARKTGLAQTTISELERGHRNATQDTLQRLADALGVLPGELLGEGENHDTPQLLRTKRLPFYGSVPAGPPTEIDADLGVREVLSHQWGSNRYVLRVHGESMWPKYQPNDLVLVEWRASADPAIYAGKTCICLVNGESTMKRIAVSRSKNKRIVLLYGANPDTEPIQIGADDEFSIQGVVLKLIDRDD